MSRPILLTGGAGYIGAHTFVALREAGYDPIILDDFSNADHDTPDNLERITGAPVDVINASLLDKPAIMAAFEKYPFQAVIHFAAKKAVGQSVREPLMYFENNAVGLIHLLSAMEAFGTKAIVFSSSATVYGIPKTLPLTEDSPLSYTNPYGFTKLMGEQMLHQIAAVQSDLSLGILRYFNPAGAHSSGLLRQSPRNGLFPPENLMPGLLRAVRGEIPHLRIFGDDYDTPDGTGVRDYIHISDLARGHVLSLASLLAGQGSHIVNLGTGRGYSVLEMVRSFEAVTGLNVPYEIEPRRAGDVASIYADVTRAKDVLGFVAEFDLADMCAASWTD